MPNKATLTIFSNADLPHEGANVQINNSSNFTSRSKGIVDISDFIKTKIYTIEVNGIRFSIVEPIPITVWMKIEAHVRDRTLKILDSQETPTPFPAN